MGVKSNINNVIRVPRFKSEHGFEATPERSKLMSKIRARETKPEVQFRKALWSRGVRYRKNFKGLKGQPDILIAKHKLVIFIDGEFWHGYNWKEKKKKIKTNRGFWVPKIERNMQRDMETNEVLKSQGYKVIRFWEHDIKKNLQRCIDIVLDAFVDV